MKKKKLIVGITAPQSIILLKGQLSYFNNKGFDVFLMSPKTEDVVAFCKAEGATLLPIKIEREISVIKDVKSVLRIIQIFKNIRPDIINLGTPKVSLLGMIAGKICGVPARVYTCRGFRFEHETGFFRKLLIACERVTAKFSHKVLAISNSVRELGIKERVFNEDKSLVINYGSSNGVDLRLFRREDISGEEILDLKKDLKVESKFVFGYVGRLIRRKGFEELYSAFKKMYESDKDLRLVVCGKPYYDQIDERIISEAKSHPGVIMTGLVPYEQVPLYMSIFDVFVLPAYWEGFGNVLVQAAAMGIPVISTKVTGCKDAVSDKFNGELISPKSEQDLMAAMEKMKQSPELRDKYGENGLKWSKNFQGEIIWKGMENLFSSLEQ